MKEASQNVCGTVNNKCNGHETEARIENGNILICSMELGTI